MIKHAKINSHDKEGKIVLTSCSAFTGRNCCANDNISTAFALTQLPVDVLDAEAVVLGLLIISSSSSSMGNLLIVAASFTWMFEGVVDLGQESGQESICWSKAHRSGKSTPSDARPLSERQPTAVPKGPTCTQSLLVDFVG